MASVPDTPQLEETHRLRLRPLALFHVVASFIALALSVPIWKLMGLID